MAYELATGEVAVPGTLTQWLTDYFGLRRDQLIGCTNDEITQVESCAGKPLPAAYKQMLREMGKGLGSDGVHREFDRAFMLYPRLLRVREIAEEVIRDSGGDLTLLERTFPFYNWEVYRIFLLDLSYDDDDPPVLSLDEKTGQASRTFDTLSQFLASEIRERAEVRARIRRANAPGM